MLPDSNAGSGNISNFNANTVTFDWYFNRRSTDFSHYSQTTWFTTNKLIDSAKAFNIAKKLIAEKIIICNLVEEFIKIVDLILKEL